MCIFFSTTFPHTFSLSLSRSLYFLLGRSWMHACVSVFCYSLSLSLISAAWYQVKWWHDYQQFDGMLCQISVNTYQIRNSWIYIDWQIRIFPSLHRTSRHLNPNWLGDECIQLWLLSMPLSVINVVIVSVVGRFVVVAVATLRSTPI